MALNTRLLQKGAAVGVFLPDLHDRGAAAHGGSHGLGIRPSPPGSAVTGPIQATRRSMPK